jgi:hypothetical protein
MHYKFLFSLVERIISPPLFSLFPMADTTVKCFGQIKKYSAGTNLKKSKWSVTSPTMSKT